MAWTRHPGHPWTCVPAPHATETSSDTEEDSWRSALGNGGAAWTRPCPQFVRDVENVVRLRLDVGRVAHVHGRSRFVGQGLKGRGPLANKLVIRPFDHSILIEFSPLYCRI